MNKPNILETIVSKKREEVRSNKELFPVKLLERSIFFSTPTVSLRKYLSRTDLLGVIAEIKRKSPSKGVINKHVNIEELSIGYMQAGASALSVLTDNEFFGGSSQDLSTARKFNFCPILRKDFIIDEYQLIEAKSIGADVILLIAAILTPREIKGLAETAKKLGLEVLLEVHSEEELVRSITPEVDVVGVNNRNLADFSVNLELSTQLYPKIPREFLRIVESGIDNVESLVRLKKVGFNGFLIGEAFMKNSKPEAACAAFISKALGLLEQQ